MQTRQMHPYDQVLPAHWQESDALPIKTKDGQQGDIAPPAVLLLALGPQAEIVTERTVALSAQGLTAPPIWTLTVPPANGHTSANGYAPYALESIDREVRALCEQMATATFGFARNGDAPAPVSKPLKIWVVLDICTVAAQSAPDIAVTEMADQARHLWQLLEVVVWQRLRMTPTPVFFLLASTQHKHAVELCRRRLATLAPTAFYLAGPPPNAGVPTLWHDEAATALVALLWTDQPSPAVPGQQPLYYAVGAVAWWIPVEPIKRLLALFTVHGRIQQLLTSYLEPSLTSSDKRIVSSAIAPAGLLVQQWRKAGEQLATFVPVPTPVALMRNRPRWWREAKDPAKILLAHVHIQGVQQNQEQRSARQQWLATQLSAWEATWRQWNTIDGGWSGVQSAHNPVPGAYCHQLQELNTQLTDAMQAMDDRLTLLVETTTTAESQVQAVCDELTPLCAELPTCSINGLWRLCSQPTLWPTWLWQWTVTLPRRLRKLGRALTTQAEALYAEANANTQRQLGLAIWQDLRLQRAWVDELRQQATALATYLEEQMAACRQALPAQGDRQGDGQDDRRWVEALRDQLAVMGQGDNHRWQDTLARLLQRDAQDEWRDSTPEALGEELLVAYANQFDWLDTWSIDDWLASAFAPRDGSGQHTAYSPRHKQPTDPALSHWLDQLARQAHPRGLAAQPIPHTGTETWVILPPGRESERQPAWRLSFPHNIPYSIPHSRQPFQAWLQTQPNGRCVESPVKALFVLRLVAVE